MAMPPGQNAGRRSRPANIAINAHLLTDQAGYRRAGIHQYIGQVLDHLPDPTPAATYTVFSRHAAALARRSGFQVCGSAWPTENRLMRIMWEQLAWPWAASHSQVDLLHSMAFVTPVLSSIPAVVTVYDLSFLHFPETYPTLQRLYLRSQTARSCRRARRIITISQSGRQDVHRLFGVPLSRIDVVYPGVDTVFQPLPPAQVTAFQKEKGLSSKVILHVGTLQPRKNISLLIEALAKLKRADILLVLVGGRGWLYDELFSQVRDRGLERHVRFVGYVSDADLPLWYNAASVVTFPSVYEGFGMPVVEAMACGTPVVAARSSSLPEAGGDAALYFDVNDADKLCTHLEAVLDDENLVAVLRRKGLEQASSFSWRKSGEETATVYGRALAEE